MRALLFTTGIALLTGLLFGLAPALKVGSAGASGVGSRLRMSRFLVVGQLALSTLLLANARLFVRTLVNLSRIDPGFNASQLLIFTVDGIHSVYKAEKLTDLYERIRLKIAALPGVLEATLSDVSLIANSMSSSDLTMPGYTPKSPRSPTLTTCPWVAGS